MADLSDSDLPDFSQIEAFNMEDESGGDSDSSDDSSEYDSAQEEAQDGAQDGDYELDEQEDTPAPAPAPALHDYMQGATDAAASNQLTEENTYGYVPPAHLPAAFKRKPPPGRPRLTPHERARREEARMLKKAEERSKRTIRRHETNYTKSRKAEICLYLLTQRVELLEGQVALRMREGIKLGAPERMPGPGEELVRYRPVNFEDACKKWRVPVSTVSHWWRKRAKILGKDHPALTKKLSYFEVVPMRENRPEPRFQVTTGPVVARSPPPTVPTVKPVVEKPIPAAKMPLPPAPRYLGREDRFVSNRARTDVVHLGPPPGVQAYLWELGV